MGSTKPIDEGHVKLLLALVLLVAIAILSYFHWNTAINLMSKTFKIGYWTYGYEALMFFSAYLSFYFGMVILKGFSKQKTYKTVAYKGELTTKDAVLKGCLGISPKPDRIKKELKDAKLKYRSSPHRVAATVGFITLIISTFIVEWYMMKYYTWVGVTIKWPLYFYSVSFYVAAQIIGFGIGFISFIPTFAKKSPHQLVR